VRPAGWLAAREARVRRTRAALAVGLVAVAVALGTGLELLARSREAAAAGRIDGMGPALRVVPAGVGGSALARLDLAGTALPPGSADRVAAALGGMHREVRPRLVLSRAIGGRATPVIGADPGPADGAVLGPALAARLGTTPVVQAGGISLMIRGVREPSGDAEDAAAHVSLATARRLAGGAEANELQVFLRAGVPPQEARARLEAAGLGAAVVSGARGEVADGGIQGALARGRRAAQAVLAVIVALGLAVAAHLDASERRVEAATLVAIGALPRLVIATFLLRSLLVGALGGLAGALLGVGVTAAGEAGVHEVLAMAWGVVLGLPLLGALLGAAAAAPAALTLALRDPVEALQE
jgi:putative ABC transport system permease protein